MSPGAARALPVLLMLLACADEGLPPHERHAARCRAVLASGAAPAALHWTIIDDSVGAAVLDAYCAALGPALVHAPAADAPTAEPGAAHDVAFVAWNIALGGGDIRAFIADLRAGALTDGRAPADFVLLLQEVPRIGGPVPPRDAVPEYAIFSSNDPVHGPDILELAGTERLHLLFVPSMREDYERLRVDHGTAILSTLPLAAPRAIELPAGMRRRVATSARVMVGDVPVSVVSVHLDNFSFRHLPGSFGGVRARQARALAAALPDTGAVVLGGDLNTWTRGTREPAYRLLRARLPRPERLQPHATARRLGVPRRLDYLLLDAPAEFSFVERRIEDRYGSDHHPLLGLLGAPGAGPRLLQNR